MYNFDPLQIADLVVSRYLSYLRSTFQFRDPDFRASFEKALELGSLTCGPFLEITPGFAEGAPVPAMLADLLGDNYDLGLAKALGGERRLYAHQDQAIRLADAGKNIVVATGTGSGKTEAFLIPILTHLYREHLAGTLGAGVRALLLYPLNALANDQRRRLAAISEDLDKSGSSFNFTFGRYVGETPDNTAPTGTEVLSGELVTRDQMRRAPPHILITNYSMLEYLLLRPWDSSLFDDGRGATWTFLVLDEAHQYRGSRGAEMAMLVRRLKQRLVEGGCQRALRCIATSATLAQGRDDAADIASFASELFGEPFHDESVVLAESAKQKKFGGVQLAVEDYDELSEAMNSPAQDGLARITAIAQRVSASTDPTHDVRTAIGSLLVRDHRVRQLMDEVASRPSDLVDLGDNLFSESERSSRPERLAKLVNLLTRVREPDTGAALVSARYHLMLRTLDGVYLSYTPEKRALLERRSDDSRGAVFEAGLCRECGQHYLLGQLTTLREGRLSEPERDLGSESFGVRYLRPLDSVESEAESVESGAEFRNLCIECGCLDIDKPSCEHNRMLRVAVEPLPKDAERRDQISRCGRCEYSGIDPVREAMHSANGPNVVVATALFEGLPEKGQKILAFRDGRQEAAFFAWYAEQTHQQFVRRALLLDTVRRLAPLADGQLSLNDIAPHLRNALQDAGEVPESMSGLAASHEAWGDLYREFLTDQRRISLEGVGLVYWDVVWPSWHGRALSLLRERLSLDKQESHDLAFLLLDTLRNSGAIELRTPDGITLGWHDLGLRSHQTNARIGARNTDSTVLSWNGERTGRAALLSRVFQAKSVPPKRARARAVDLLGDFWEALTSDDGRAPSTDQQLLLRTGDGKRMNPDWWRIGLQIMGTQIHQCTACGRRQARNVADICPRYRCPGVLIPADLDRNPDDHYRLLYEQSLRRTFRAEEHTAQLVTKRAQEVQQDFERGSVNLLSCSTTFELGVDLGDLDIVFLRNVPPEPFNYVQRVGRAGRRERPGFAVTYCRRTPHDLYHFNEPRSMLQGLTRPPALSLRNEKIVRRHMAAVAVAAFLREQPERFGNVNSLLRDMEDPTFASDVAEYLRANEANLVQHLTSIVPQTLHTQLGLYDLSWIEQVAGQESRLAEAESETKGDCETLQKLENESSTNRDYSTAGWARRRLATIESENALTYLSRKVVIPKYGFPVDVVELDLQKNRDRSQATANVTLQRDLSLAISEYAPTAEVVAAKRMWKSYGLKLVPGRAWPRRTYRRCHQHHTFVQWEAGESEQRLPCGCEPRAASYVEPRFGFITRWNYQSTEPRRAPQRLFATRPFFAGLDSDPPFAVPTRGILEVTPAHPGTMVTLCEGRFGRGFWLCERCGAGFRARKQKHETPFGQECRGRLQSRALGHEFTTDISQVDFLLPRSSADGMEPLWFAYSMAYALAQGAAQTLDIPATDLNATVRRRPRTSDYTIVLYDNVPGGAGLVARLSEIPLLTDALRAARKRVSGVCGCSEITSCYGCLRSFSNQFAHPHLQRGPVASYLTEVLEKLQS